MPSDTTLLPPTASMTTPFNRIQTRWRNFCANLPATPIAFKSAAHAYLALLARVHALPALYTNKHILKTAIRRYEIIWLPLLLSLPSRHARRLVPPLDVEWVWCCHMLAPAAYMNDMRAVSGADSSVFMDHEVLFGPARDTGLKEARALWEARYPSEPFSIDEHIQQAPMLIASDEEGVSMNSPSTEDNPTRITYDIAAAARHQMHFYYQVALPHYRDPCFLQTAITRYFSRFLHLQKLYPGQIACTTYDVRLIWHVHMLHPSQYAFDTTRLCGQLLPHDSALIDASPCSELTGNRMRELWMQNFKESGPKLAGTMWRGNVSLDERILQPLIEQHMKQVAMNCDSIIQKGVTSFQITACESSDLHPALRKPENIDIPWIHTREVHGSPRFSHDAFTSRDCIERFTSLCPLKGPEATSPILHCRTIHCLQSSGRIASALEIYPGTTSGTHAYPLATAHLIDERQLTVYRHQLQEAAVLARLQADEKALLLRMGGHDVAVLIARWKGFHRPFPEISGNTYKRDPHRGDGREGRLSLRVGSLGDSMAGETNGRLWKYISLSDSNPPSFTLPSNFLCFGPESENRKGNCIEAGLSEGEIRCGVGDDVLLGYLMGMSVAMFFVMLQPRSEPKPVADGENVTSMHPAWATAQMKVSTLEGAGGEVPAGGSAQSYGGLLLRGNRFAIYGTSQNGGSEEAGIREGLYD